MNLNRVAVQFTAVLKEVLDEEEFDVVLDSDGELNVSTDDWTVHLEDEIGWIAIDDEPDKEADYAAALKSVFPIDVLRAFNEVDQQSEGELIGALRAGNDPLTREFLSLLASST
jgi:hypothetical protein